MQNFPATAPYHSPIIKPKVLAIRREIQRKSMLLRFFFSELNFFVHILLLHLCHRAALFPLGSDGSLQFSSLRDRDAQTSRPENPESMAALPVKAT
jgi:hypothetical protein